MRASRTTISIIISTADGLMMHRQAIKVRSHQKELGRSRRETLSSCVDKTAGYSLITQSYFQHEHRLRPHSFLNCCFSCYPRDLNLWLKFRSRILKLSYYFIKVCVPNKLISCLLSQYSSPSQQLHRSFQVITTVPATEHILKNTQKRHLLHVRIFLYFL